MPQAEATGVRRCGRSLVGKKLAIDFPPPKKIFRNVEAMTYCVLGCKAEEALSEIGRPYIAETSCNDLGCHYFIFHPYL